MTTPTNPQDRTTRSAWDRSGCREPVCWCHDDSPIALRQGFACSGCGCRVLNGTDYSKAATPPTGSPAARTAETAPESSGSLLVDLGAAEYRPEAFVRELRQLAAAPLDFPVWRLSAALLHAAEAFELWREWSDMKAAQKPRP